MSATLESIQAPHGGPKRCEHLPWGAHFCHVYETAGELLEVLVPFFREGLANGEQCLWITSAPLTTAEAAAALTARMPDLADRLARGQIRIIDHEDWYSPTGRIEEDSILEAWIDAEQHALATGWTGLRLTGNVTFLNSDEDWHAFECYESRVSQTFAGRRIIALCTYHAQKTSAARLQEIVRNHQFRVSEYNGGWEVVEEAGLAAGADGSTPSRHPRDETVNVTTASLQEALSLVQAQKTALERALRQRDEGRRQLEQELDDAQLLQELSVALIEEEVVERLFDRIVDGAARLLQSDFATMQRLDRTRGDLELIASRGLTAQDVALWRWVKHDENTSCGLALRARARSLVYNYVDDPRVDPPTRAAFASAGIVAAQSTPLISRSGELLGMISTHWARPHRPSERQLRLLDVVARQAADLLERSEAMQALQARTRELVDADHRKDEFLATLAHELRNPLAPLRNGLSLMRADRAEVRERALPMMERQLNHMVRLVDDLLDIARISRGTITLERRRVRLDEIIQTAAETSRPLIQAAGHELGIALPDQPLWVDADLTRMAQVVSNVLNNAAKYTPDGGRIVLSTARRGGDVEISVADNGVGIPGDMLDKVFDMFTQVETSRNRSHGGLGLGLALARYLVTMHGGSITARSGGAGSGTTVSIRLPLMLGPPAAVTNAADANQGVLAQRVLVVDDNADAAASLGLLLESEGHVVRVIVDSTRAVGEAMQFRPDTIFLDLGMPRLDGYRLAELLRAQECFRATRLVAISGWGTSADQERSRRSGIDSHLTKPATLESIRCELNPAPAARVAS